MSWMAWTWPTALFFIGIFSAMGVLTVLELRYPGGDERKGAFGLVTTRGDRLFMQEGVEIVRFSERAMVKLSALMEDAPDGLCLCVEGLRYPIRDTNESD